MQQNEKSENPVLDGVQAKAAEKTRYTGGYHAIVSLEVPAQTFDQEPNQSFGPLLGLYWEPSQNELKKRLARVGSGAKVLAIFRGRQMEFETKQSIAFS